jgi:hypothetical protein
MRRIGVQAGAVAAALAVGVLAGAGPQQSRAARIAGRCPRTLPADRDAAREVLAAAAAAEARARVVGIISLSPYSLGTDEVWRRIARDRCGALVASRSWVAFYFRPEWARQSASIAEGASYLVRTRSGWRVWYRYR